MPRIPIEDNYADILGKAQRGLRITDEQLAARAEITPAELASLKAGQFDEAAARRVARHLRLHPGALVNLASKKWYPTHPVFRSGFAAFNAPHDDMTVNSYLVWDHRSRQAALFDPGASGEKILDYLAAEKLSLRQIFLTHAHEDHIADLGKILAAIKTATPPEVWISAREASDVPEAKPFADNTIFHIGDLTLRSYPTSGHSPGGTTYYTTDLSYPLAIVGDSLFAGSMGGSADAYDDAIKNNWKYILSLPRDTVLACGHGPITTLAQEKKNNPFFARW
ncbi:hydroxyacylglutathione hydrolase [Ereboglobus sp. PH5-10]|uniref:MBL fold metallo-hydrolase n=1 Tax=Ereboglobus sp. PH5-10 TaxID=2940629 RepID=UPI0024062F68|nr:MBL fold metallo-hydrolase [Ereboglobus sp. PH5-10]MDF9827574.1 hydroxyacylglutathione hydrolase [Ereboglobus sp. PH5-10]